MATYGGVGYVPTPHEQWLMEQERLRTEPQRRKEAEERMAVAKAGGHCDKCMFRKDVPCYDCAWYPDFPEYDKT